MSKMIHYYRKMTDVPSALLSSIHEELTIHGYTEVHDHLVQMDMEYCYNILPSVSVDSELTTEQTKRLEWLLAETFEPHHLQREQSFFDTKENEAEEHSTTGQRIMKIIEYGPRMTFTSAFSSNATSICQACDIPITRMELSKRYRLHISITSTTTTTASTTTTTTTSPNSIIDETNPKRLKESVVKIIHSILHDRMTQEVYDTPLVSFDSGIDQVEPTKTIPIMEHGRAALEQINQEMGLGFDDFDLNYYTELFKVTFFFLFVCGT